VRLQGERKIDFPSLEKRQFDRVILNPPRESRGPFGTVNLLKDYESWFRPALLCVRPGGQLLATHKSESVNREDWIHSIIRTAQSLDRDLDFEVLHPEADFPSSDEKPPLKMLVVEVR